MIQSGEIERLSRLAGELRAFRARKYAKEKRVNIINILEDSQNAHTILAKVTGESSYNVEINETNGKITGYSCDCFDDAPICKHILSTVIEVCNKYNGLTQIKEDTFKYKEFTQLMNYFLEDEKVQLSRVSNEIRILPVIKYEGHSGYSVSFKVGTSQFYKIKNIVEFCDDIENGLSHKYGNNLEFVHERSAFNSLDLPLLDFIIKYGSIIRYSNNNMSNSYYNSKLSESKIFIDSAIWDELFDILISHKVEFKDMPVPLLFVDELDSVKFEVEEINENECKIINKVNFNSYIQGYKYIYVIEDDKFKRYLENTPYMDGLLNAFFANNVEEIVFGKKELNDLFTLVVPKLNSTISLEKISKESLDKYMPKKLGVKLFLDIDKNRNVVCNVKFCYGDFEFNPLEDDKEDIVHNKKSEEDVKKCFYESGFKLDDVNKSLYIDDEEKIYDFLTNGINYYMDKFEVLATDNFKTLEIKQPRIGSVGVKIENNLLNINFNNLNFDISEVKEIMQKYKLKKKYHRLKNGTFISIQGNEDIEFIDDLLNGMDVDFKNLDKSEIKLPVHRSLYLNKLLEKDKLKKVSKDESFKKIVREISDTHSDNECAIPKSLDEVLRLYQKNGYNWLMNLDAYGFGGILADDMGLGKTLQIISVLLSYKENVGEKTSIVVCPSSLVLNWEREIKKFAPKISMLIISGNAVDRKNKVNNYGNCDLIITSYDSLKRDIDEYTKIGAKFKYAIADEAQYIKNGNTQNAKSLKELDSEIRFALTGTPIENSLAELWSIFDYIMPGYLFSYSKFKNNYEIPIVKENDAHYMEKLKMLIEPFILRRNKKDVLTELPEKTITLMYNDMAENQKKIYLNYLMQTKNELASSIESAGFEKSKLKILALLTRLRQICCHPSLFIDNYYGESGKLEQCMELVKDAVDGGHKILLFSSYTSMFDILEEDLRENGIEYFKLTGKTKVDERIKLVEEFNKNKDIKVFLISLKAGGTGLNLTGADVVIHYDPWWNLAAENQATDRAYRIGQKNNVQVYKLITKDSIEEKIAELQEKKSKLIDDVLSTEETFISKLSKEDILALFD